MGWVRGWERQYYLLQIHVRDFSSSGILILNIRLVPKSPLVRIGIQQRSTSAEIFAIHEPLVGFIVIYRKRIESGENIIIALIIHYWHWDNNWEFHYQISIFINFKIFSSALLEEFNYILCCTVNSLINIEMKTVT